VQVGVVAAAFFAAAVALWHDERRATEPSDARLEIYFMYNEGESQQKWFAAAVDRFKEYRAARGKPIEVEVVYAGREVLGKLRPRLIIGNPLTL